MAYEEDEFLEMAPPALSQGGHINTFASDAVMNEPPEEETYSIFERISKEEQIFTEETKEQRNGNDIASMMMDDK